jgi:hypothetical protein
MKLLAATIALAKAQDAIDAGDDSRTFSFGDSAYSFGAYDSGNFDGNFYDSAYGSDYAGLSDNFNYEDGAAPADAAANAATVDDEAARDKDEARYFGGAATTATTTTAAVVTATTHETDVYCLKCDVMSITACATASEAAETCAHGDVCFLEIRRNNPRTGNDLTQICTGCKSAQACYDLKAQNMVAGTGTPRGMMQCFPTRHLLNTGHRLGEMASVCRTCFIPSDVAEDTAGPTTDSNNDDHFFKGKTGGTAGQFEIPVSGTGATAANTYQLYGATFLEFTNVWFTLEHGLSQAVHGLNFALPVPTE